MDRRVVITGIEAISCFGVGPDRLWKAVCDKQTGIDRVKGIDVSQFRCQIGAEVPEFDLSERVDPKITKRADRFISYALYCADAALEKSGLQITEQIAPDVGVLVGSGIGGMTTWEAGHETLLEKGARRVSPFLIPMMIADKIGRASWAEPDGRDRMCDRHALDRRSGRHHLPRRRNGHDQRRHRGVHRHHRLQRLLRCPGRLVQ